MIDLIYLNESKRIRKEYLENLAYIVDKEDEINIYVNEIKRIQNVIDNSPDDIFEDFVEKLKLIDENINKINKYINISYDKIKELDVDQRKLYYAIKDKYPNISDDDMKYEIMEFIEPVNSEFIKNNSKLYDKINNKQSNYE